MNSVGLRDNHPASLVKVNASSAIRALGLEFVVSLIVPLMPTFWIWAYYVFYFF